MKFVMKFMKRKRKTGRFICDEFVGNHGIRVNNIIPKGLLQGVDLYKIDKTNLSNLPIAIVFTKLISVWLSQIRFVNWIHLRFPGPLFYDAAPCGKRLPFDKNRGMISGLV